MKEKRERQTDRPTDRQTERQREKQAERERERERQRRAYQKGLCIVSPKYFIVLRNELHVINVYR